MSKEIEKLFSKNIKLIKELHSSKGRKKYNSFIVEGYKTLAECGKVGLLPEYIVYNSSNIKNSEDNIIEKLTLDIKKIKIYETDEFKKISTLTNSEGVLGVFSKEKCFKTETVTEFLSDKNNIIVLFDINDPGNFGTIIRTAKWFGIDGIITVGNSVNFFSSKVIRSSMGAIFSTEIININRFDDNMKDFDKFYKIGTFLDKKNDLNKIDLLKIKKKMILFGNEANGLDEKLFELVDANFIIGSSKEKSFESLNLSIAAGIAMFDIFYKK